MEKKTKSSVGIADMVSTKGEPEEGGVGRDRGWVSAEVRGYSTWLVDFQAYRLAARECIWIIPWDGKKKIRKTAHRERQIVNG